MGEMTLSDRARPADTDAEGKLRERSSSARRVPSRAELRLARGLAHGEESAIKAIEAEYAPTLRGYLEHVLRDRATAEEVLQQVLLEAWQRGASYDPRRGSPLSWLMANARSRAIDQLRRRVPEPLEPNDAAAMIDRRDPVADLADQIAERWRVAHMLARLPRDESDLLRMRFELGMSQSAIAAETGIALGTVKMRMARGLRSLRAALDADEGRDG